MRGSVFEVLIGVSEREVINRSVPPILSVVLGFLSLTDLFPAAKVDPFCVRRRLR